MNHIFKIRTALAPADLDAVLLTCRANRFYASGFDSYDTDGVCLVTADAAYYWTDGRYIEAASRQVQDAEVGLTDAANPYHVLIAGAIKRHGIRRLGIDDGYMTLADYRRYRDQLPCELLPATSVLTRLRARKDTAELARMERAQRIAEGALEEVLNDIRPGVTEQFLAARLVFLMRNAGAENVSFDPIVISGAKTSMPHGVPSGKQVEAGDFVTMDFGALCEGYCSDMTRTVAVGSATEEMERVYETVLSAQKAGIAMARAGVAGSVVDDAARRVIAKAGYGDYFTHSFGHSLGVEIHESPNASPSNPEPLPEGAVVSAEPGIYLPGKFGVRIEDVVVLEEDGCRNLTRAPKELLILPA